MSDSRPAPAGASDVASSAAPARGGWVLASLILVAAVANLNLAVANVALPDIGRHFDSSQTTLDLIAVAYALGLACSVVWFGALGDRHGRKLMAVGGTILAIPFSLLAAFAPSDTVLAIARLGGGLAAGMAYPTTLTLITALWSGPGHADSFGTGHARRDGFGHRRPAARPRRGDHAVDPRRAADRGVRGCGRGDDRRLGQERHFEHPG